MSVSKGLPRFAAALSACLFAGCGSLPEVLQGSSSIEVAEVRRLLNCNSDGPQTRLSLLADREAVRAWQGSHNVDLVGVDPLPEAGAYALVEMGVHMSAGYGLAISRRAQISGLTITLSASLLSPDAGEAAAQMLTSPCVLVALPHGTYRAAELRDPAGNLLARADAATPVQ
ncbi:protease complex subunit PrcB family protein [Nevskia soli]|uniref:protease complex subunit PrcB family protein n=1 Tax=Nevskia soli TaxID=418856 RepID=UPI0012F954CB|nr:protease complex subunit PrcB family protein [Nevskia soli]